MYIIVYILYICILCNHNHNHNHNHPLPSSTIEQVGHGIVLSLKVPSRILLVYLSRSISMYIRSILRHIAVSQRATVLKPSVGKGLLPSLGFLGVSDSLVAAFFLRWARGLPPSLRLKSLASSHVW